MASPRSYLSRSKVADDIKKIASVTSLVIGLPCAFIFFLTVTTLTDDHSKKAYAHKQAVGLELLLTTEARSTDERQQIASAILNLDTAQVTNVAEDISDAGIISSDEVRQALQATARTGEPLLIETSEPVNTAWLVAAIILAIAFCLYGLICISVYTLRYCYSNISSDESRFIVDVNSRHIGTLFIMASWVVAWPFYVISAIRLHKTKKMAEISSPQDGDSNRTVTYVHEG